uniref:histone-lysine N-methyltransferase, H3 lysine-79 specific-like n=1 Tax=Styela clava TaxID=7725 RepID=UPI00193931AA|nr:histone-lysine N-methyltransferase, H3 lysine-79 specific-like [Styela clava]
MATADAHLNVEDNEDDSTTNDGSAKSDVHETTIFAMSVETQPKSSLALASENVVSDHSSGVSKDLFLRIPDVDSVSHLSSRKNTNKEKSVASCVAEEMSTNTHVMTTRSKVKQKKSTVLTRDCLSRNSKRRSLKTFRSASYRSTSVVQSQKSALNLTLEKEWQELLQQQQVEEEEIRKEKQRQEEELRKEKQRQEEELRHERQRQEEEIRIENQHKREAFMRRRQEIQQKRKIENVTFNRRKQRTLQEIEDRSRRELLGLDMDFNETLAESGIFVNKSPSAVIANDTTNQQSTQNSVTTPSEPEPDVQNAPVMLPVTTAQFSQSQITQVTRTNMLSTMSRRRTIAGENGESVIPASKIEICNPQNVSVTMGGDVAVENVSHVPEKIFVLLGH